MFITRNLHLVSSMKVAEMMYGSRACEHFMRIDHKHPYTSGTQYLVLL